MKNLKSTNLSSTGSRLVYADSQGNLVLRGRGDQSYITEGAPCVPGALPWFVGGNTLDSPPNFVQDIGTCDNTDFILKANNVQRQWIKPSGSIGFGANFTSNIGDPVQFIFSNGLVRAKGNNANGGPMYMFDGPTSPFGDWGLEYTGGTGAPQPGLNFWKPFGSPNSNNNILFLHDNNRIGIGTDNPTTRLTIDAWNDNALLILTDPNKNVIDVKDKVSNFVNFRVKSTGEVFARRVKVMVASATFPDYVFEKDYKVMSLYETEAFYIKYKHLPEIPTAKEVEENNLDLGEMNKPLLKKIEEMTILMVEMKKEIDSLKKEK